MYKPGSFKRPLLAAVLPINLQPRGRWHPGNGHAVNGNNLTKPSTESQEWVAEAVGPEQEGGIRKFLSVFGAGVAPPVSASLFGSERGADVNIYSMPHASAAATVLRSMVVSSRQSMARASIESRDAPSLFKDEVRHRPQWRPPSRQPAPAPRQPAPRRAPQSSQPLSSLRPRRLHGSRHPRRTRPSLRPLRICSRLG